MDKSNHENISWPESGLEFIEKCHVCESVESEKVYEGLEDNIFFCAPGKWALFKCNDCGAVYLNPRPNKETIGLAYKNYFTHSLRDTNKFNLINSIRRVIGNGYRNKKYGTNERPALSLGYWLAKVLPTKRAELDAKMRHLPPALPGDHLLDVGCGNGDFLVRAKDCGWEVVGVEPDAIAAQVARGRGIDVYEGGIEAASGMEEMFKGITLSHVIEHVHDPEKLLKDCYKLLKHDGWIWVETPNVNSLGFRRYGRDWGALDPPRHLVLFNRELLQRMLKKVGFDSIEDMPFRNVCPTVFKASEMIRIRQHKTIFSVRIAVRVVSYVIGFRERFSPCVREFVTLRGIKAKN